MAQSAHSPRASLHGRHRSRSAHHALLFGVTKNKRALWTAGIAIVVLAAALGVVLLTTDLDWSSIMEGWGRMTDRIAQLNAAAVIPLMAVLPVAGFPIAVVYLVAGARFGPLLGGVIVLGVTIIHMILTYLIGRSVLRAPLQRLIERRHKHLPEVPHDEQAAVAVIAALVPGLPYFVRNYLLVLAGVRLSVLLWVCAPIYLARSYVTILLGNLSGDPSKTALIVLVIFDVLKVGICALVIWRLRVHHRRYHGHHDAPAHDHAGDAPVQPSAAAK